MPSAKKSSVMDLEDDPIQWLLGRIIRMMRREEAKHLVVTSIILGQHEAKELVQNLNRGGGWLDPKLHTWITYTLESMKEAKENTLFGVPLVITDAPSNLGVTTRPE